MVPLATVTCITSVILGRIELIGMEAGKVDLSGRLITRVALMIAIVGTVLWSALLVLVRPGAASGGGIGPL